MTTWLLINALGFIGTPAGLIDGWITYSRTAERSRVRARISLTSLSLASCSTLILVAALVVARAFALHSVDRPIRLAISVGLYSAIAGCGLALAGKPRLIPSTVIANIGATMLWFALTQP